MVELALQAETHPSNNNNNNNNKAAAFLGSDGAPRRSFSEPGPYFKEAETTGARQQDLHGRHTVGASQ